MFSIELNHLLLRQLIQHLEAGSAVANFRTLLQEQVEQGHKGLQSQFEEVLGSFVVPYLRKELVWQFAVQRVGQEQPQRQEAMEVAHAAGECETQITLAEQG